MARYTHGKWRRVLRRENIVICLKWLSNCGSDFVNDTTGRFAPVNAVHSGGNAAHTAGNVCTQAGIAFTLDLHA